MALLKGADDTVLFGAVILSNYFVPPVDEGSFHQGMPWR